MSRRQQLLFCKRSVHAAHRCVMLCTCKCRAISSASESTTAADDVLQHGKQQQAVASVLSPQAGQTTTAHAQIRKQHSALAFACRMTCIAACVLQPTGVPDDATDETRHTHVQKQQRWLLYLRHCAKCHVPGNECSLKQQCKFGKQLWQHILSCQETECPFPRCTTSKELLKHHQRCQVRSIIRLPCTSPRFA